MKKNNSISLAVMTICAATMLFSSCEKENGVFGGSSKYLTLSVNTNSTILTKSVNSEVLETVDLSENGTSLFLTGKKSINNSPVFGPMTKANAEIKYENINEFPIRMVKPAGEGYIDGIANKDNEKSHDADFWSVYNGSSKVEWSETEGVSNFLAYYPAESGSFGEGSSTVKYTGDNQNDFIMAYKDWNHDHQNYHNPDTYVPLTFYHPLALVKFTFGDGVNVSKVVINNVTTKADITINYGDTFETTSFVYAPVTAGNISFDVNGDSECSFYVVPGAIGADGINVTFYVDDEIYTTKNLGVANSGNAWEAGYIYDYVLSDGYSTNGKVDIIIKDGKIVNNTPNAFWVRASFVATKFNAKGMILNSKMITDATIDGWTKNSEGFYYYDEPCVGYQSLDLSSVTCPEGMTLTIAAQAIPYNLGSSAADAYDSIAN